MEIPLGLDELRQLSLWTADCAERALPLYEAAAPGDSRARDAIEAVRAFGVGGKRTKAIRTAAFAALKAAGQFAEAAAQAGTEDAGTGTTVAVQAAEAAARAAVGAAGSAYLHPFAAATQVKHIVASAQYAAYAEELATGAPAAADAVIAWALKRVPGAVREVIARYPEGSAGRGRLGELHRAVESGLRRPSTS
ncbi:putative immunity protein [Kribbella sp.]|uniref:putative immunity protein n=1 Tax=Kribbella sp. TaxID=1871183 RepID=UPI002D697983|nr:exonuclease SbcC [Kribbella sp.]HZX07044.1 exonuclease SbcC [Kribbella sp.]